MRTRDALALSALLLTLTAGAAGPAVADVGAGGGANPAPALPSRIEARCGKGVDTAFPIGARIRGGPAVYRMGAEPQSWYLDLANTTDSRCTAIHPVVVFTDRARSLRPAHLRMRFDGPGGSLPVSVERSDRDEVIAVFDGGSRFPGFTVDAGASLTVKVSLAFAPDAPTGEVVADAALVRRAGEDGDWVGEAGTYRFAVSGPDPSDRGSWDGDGDEGRAEAGALAHTGGPPASRAERDRPRTGPYALAAFGTLTLGAGLLLTSRRLRGPVTVARD
ncbi:hypothetical protein ACN20G_17030 [Streptomyces sp. BI20]|uniref:hypothetical protein n=1 Tax=Streptomyces sp. BI20 TaxID=3403460 RepID=UPI003C737D3D